jgi:soluble lytic murein transglycosylase-like protein
MKNMLKNFLKKMFMFMFIIYSVNNAYAGAQKEEDLSYSVRSALIKSIDNGGPIDPKSFFNQEADPQKYQKYLVWQQKVSAKLQKKISNEVLRQDLIDSIYFEAKRAGLEPELVLGLIQVESGFKKYAMSHVKALGLMQVMPFWTKAIGNGDVNALFNAQVNLRYGCSILRHYIDKEKGNLYLALGRYNGSRGQPQYPNAVLAAWNSWKNAVDA